jgi:hypothetical protein
MLPRNRRAVLVELSLLAVAPWFSKVLGLEVFRFWGCPLLVQAPIAGDLPCPSVPLQSVTAGASRRVLWAGGARLVVLRGAKSPASSSRSAALPALGLGSRRSWPSFAALRGLALSDTETGVLVPFGAASSRSSAEAWDRLEAVHVVGLPSRMLGRSSASSLGSPTRGLGLPQLRGFRPGPASGPASGWPRLPPLPGFRPGAASGAATSRGAPSFARAEAWALLVAGSLGLTPLRARAEAWARRVALPPGCLPSAPSEAEASAKLADCPV